MQVGLDVLRFVGFLGAGQAVAIGAALLSMRPPRTRLLGALLVVLGLAIGVIVVSHLGTGGESDLLQGLETGLSLLGPPLFYSWVRLVVSGRERGSRSSLLHFAVPALWLAGAVVALLAGRGFAATVVPIGLVVAYQAGYTLLAGYRVIAGDAEARVLPGELALARTLLVLFLLIHVAQLVRFATPAPALRNVVPLTATLGLLVMTVAAVRSSRLFHHLGDRRPKYEGSTLSEERVERALVDLGRAMEVERRFLDPELSLRSLGRELGLTRSHLSQLVNERCGRSFPEYLAELRVREAERWLRDPAADHVTVEAIGERSGFRSRSAFYDAFKRCTGRTPAAYRDERGARGAEGG